MYSRNIGHQPARGRKTMETLGKLRPTFEDQGCLFSQIHIVKFYNLTSESLKPYHRCKLKPVNRSTITSADLISLVSFR